MQSKQEKRQDFLRDLIAHLMTHPVQTTQCANATDDEVRQFIMLFMEPTMSRFNHDITSYGLKHIAERTIGHLFYGSDNYHYVSNDQFKRVINETGHFFRKQSSHNSPNDIYCFRWREGAEDVFYALGVHGTNKRGILQERDL